MTTNSINNSSSSLQASDINISGSTISTTTTNTDLNLTPSGSGNVVISGAYSLPSSDGTANQILQSDSAGNVTFVSKNIITDINIQIFTSNGTYTPSVGMVQCIIEVVGGGAGGGGTSLTTLLQCSAGAGGGGGGYAKGLFSALVIGASKTVSIGAAGAGGNGGASSSGGTTSVGSLISATGGTGVALGIASNVHALSGGNGGVGSGGLINSFGTPGEPSYGGFGTQLAYNRGGAGGNSTLGCGGYEQTIQPTAGFSGSANGHSATGFGGGGGGGTTIENNAARSGGSGFAGVVIITEYIQ